MVLSFFKITEIKNLTFEISDFCMFAWPCQFRGAPNLLSEQCWCNSGELTLGQSCLNLSSKLTGISPSTPLTKSISNDPR